MTLSLPGSLSVSVLWQFANWRVWRRGFRVDSVFLVVALAVAFPGMASSAPGEPDPTFVPPPLNGSVRALAVQSDGRIVVGGSFTNVAGTARSGLIRLLENGALDTSFDAGMNFLHSTNEFVSAIALLPDGRILCGGTFTHINGQVRPGLARFLPAGDLDPAFVPAIGPMIGAVNNGSSAPESVSSNSNLASVPDTI